MQRKSQTNLSSSLMEVEKPSDAGFEAGVEFDCFLAGYERAIKDAAEVVGTYFGADAGYIKSKVEALAK